MTNFRSAFDVSASRVAARFAAGDAHKKSVALMKWLSGAAQAMGPKVAENVYVVGGAVRDFVLDRPIKDVDVVVDSEALGSTGNASWFAKQIMRRIPAQVSKETNTYLVEILRVSGSWILDGMEMEGEVIEIANTRSESYSEGGWKPESVAPTDIHTDVLRRELTYNTLLLRLIDLADGPDKKDIIDLTGCGLKDLEKGRMQCPANPDIVFKDDPTRMIRVIKFALRYGHKLTPDTKAGILRNADKIKNIPSGHLSAMIVQIVLTDSNWKKALEMMGDLTLLDPIKDILKSDKSFRAALQNHVNSSHMDMMFALMDVGLPLGIKVKFLNTAQQTRLREIALGWDRDDAWVFLEALKNVNNSLGDKSFFPKLLKQHGIAGQQIGKFRMQVMEPLARRLLLGDPDLARNPSRFRQEVGEGVARAMRTTRLAARPIRLNRRDVEKVRDQLVERLDRWVKQNRNEIEPLGVEQRKPMATATITLDDVAGRPVTAEIHLASKSAPSNPSSIVGAGAGKNRRTGMPSIIIFLNAKDKARWFTTPGSVFPIQLLKNLQHELTHIADTFDFGKPRDYEGGTKRMMAPGSPEMNWDAYYNDPLEVRAYMREIYEQIPHKNFAKFIEVFGLSKGFDYALKSTDWRHLKDEFSPKNRKLIQKGIYTALQDDGLIP